LTALRLKAVQGVLLIMIICKKYNLAISQLIIFYILVTKRDTDVFLINPLADTKQNICFLWYDSFVIAVRVLFIYITFWKNIE